MQADLDLISSSSSLHSHDDNQFAEDFDFKLNIFSSDVTQLKYDEESTEDYGQQQQGEDELEHDEEEDYEDDEDFSFVINGSDSSPISADSVFHDGQFRPVFPLFNQDLLLAHEDFKISDNRLPLRPPVNKVFIETPPSNSSSSEKTDQVDGIAAGPYCDRTKSPELSKKSNSTGFSKLWRFKEYMHRSHSDGRDAFVFLNNSDRTKGEVKIVEKKTAGICSSEKKTGGEVKVNADGGKKMAKKGKKTTPLSAHEIYLRSKGYNPEEDKRRSYLPYRPELVGFFTNVNGGSLTKNVHPY